ncbi:translocation/assembly module TamB domain-containing protein [bacterium]|nr:translocation/assembly module TamB domain-containing protein [bacterium]
MTQKRKKWGKYLLSLFLLPVALVILLMAFSQTRISKNLLKNIIVRKANQVLNAELLIEKLDGNLFTNLTLKEITLRNEKDTILFIPEIKVRYKPLKILRKEIYIDLLLIESPVGFLRQFPDSTWNFSTLVKPVIPEHHDTTEVSEPFGYSFILKNFQLVDANLALEALDTILPTGIKDINIRFSGIYSPDLMNLNLKKLGFRTMNPDFSLKEISFSASRSNGETKLENLVIVTDHNRIDGRGNYSEGNFKNSDFKLESQPLELGEFRTVFPSLRIYSNPSFSLTAGFRDDSLTTFLDLIENKQHIKLRADIACLSKLFKNAEQGCNVRYYFSIDMQQIDLAQWFGDPSLEYIINGRLNARGTGITMETATMHLSSEFSKCLIHGRLVDALELIAEYDKGNIKAKSIVRGDFGIINLKGGIKDLLNSQEYDISILAKEFNAAFLLLDDSLSSNLNFGLYARGKGFDPENIKSNIQIFASRSTFREIKIDSLFARMNITGRTASIDTLFFNNNAITLNLKGIASMDGESDLQFRFELGNLEALKGFIKADQLDAEGYLSGKVTGRIDSLSSQIELKLSDILYNTIFADSLTGNISIQCILEVLEVEGSINIRDAGTPQLSLQTVTIQGNYSGDSTVIVLNVIQSDSVSAHLEAQYLMEGIPRIVLTEIAVNLRDRTWSGSNENTEFLLGKETYSIKGFELSAPSAVPGTQQEIRVGGTISLSGEEDLQVEISNVEVKELIKAFELPLIAGGVLSINLDIKGNAEHPVIESNVALNNGYINQFDFSSLSGRLRYKDEQVSWLFSLVPALTDSLTISGYLPINLSLSNPGDLIYDEKKMEVRIRAERLPLTVLKAIGHEVEPMSGIIECDIVVGNMIKDPIATGFLRIRDGAIRAPEYGIDYKDFIVDLSINHTRITLDKLQVSRGDGKLNLNGYLEMDSSIVSGVVKDMRVLLKADKFFALRHRDFEAQVSGNAELSGNIEKPGFGGKMTVLRSSFNLPVLTGKSNMTSAEVDMSIPMLVEALQEGGMSTGTAQLTNLPVENGEKKPVEIMQNLRGKYKLILPKNTWIRSPEMKMELSGDLDLVKEGEDFEIFGFVNIIRGYYDLYGRRFNIKKGNINFQGGAEYNPEVLLQAEYIFRTADREKKYLGLSVTGKALNPILQFNINGSEITEGDAISYIMFGRSLDELTYGQQSGISNAAGGGTGDLAKGFAANILSNQLGKTLGKKLNLDYIELSAEDNWQSATFVVGKYLTNDLYMSYMRRIGESQDKDITPQTITLEYELTHFLFLQLLEGSAKESGIDIILKFEW